MVAEVNYNKVMTVIDSWERVKQTPNYDEVLGELIFIKLLNVEPAVKKVFKFKDGEDFRKHPSFELHARETVDRLDMAVSLLGPDLEPLEEDFRDLGLRHMAYGVKSDYLPSMAKALIGAIEVVLKDEFSKKEKEAWEAVFGFLVSNMDMGMKPGEW